MNLREDDMVSAVALVMETQDTAAQVEAEVAPRSSPTPTADAETRRSPRSRRRGVVGRPTRLRVCFNGRTRERRWSELE